MSDDAQRWKEKYLKSIEQQEKLERRWNARLDLLRRGLVRSTLAAEGSDRAVDQCMKEIREVVRHDDMDAGLAALIPRLEKAVLDSEQRRETRTAQVETALTAIVAQLQKLDLPKDVQRPLRKFAKQVESRAGQAREIPLLLTELSQLQGQAFSGLADPDAPARPGLLERLFGGRAQAAETDSEAPALQAEAAAPAAKAPREVLVEHDHGDESADLVQTVAVPQRPAPEAPLVARDEPLVTDDAPLPASPVAAPAPEPNVPEAPPEPTREPATAQPEVEPVPEPSAEPLAATEAEPAPVESVPAPSLPAPAADVFIDSLPLPAVMAEALAAVDPQEHNEDILYALPESSEPSYSSVAAHIEDTLKGLLGDLVLPERHRPQAHALQERLAHGLNWYELLPILDDLAVLVLAISDSGQLEFGDYLKQLNERLESFQSSLQAASEGHTQSSDAARELDTQIREHVDNLQESVLQADDLPSLKRILDGRLEGLLGTLDAHRQARDARELEVTQRLSHLVERVSHMEQEAEVYRGHLEEQRQKALVDPLTGLPNRAGWNERMEQLAARPDARPPLLAIFDVDYFKRVNDTYGHLAGDKVLKIIASQLRKRLRRDDYIARFGGEEFVLMMPATTVDQGLAHLETLRAAIEACPFHFKGEPVTITMSMGMTAMRASEACDTALKRADQALYRAKGAGRNRIEQG